MLNFGNGDTEFPLPSSAMRTRVQDWTRVHILTSPVITDHWTEAQPFFFTLS